MGPYRKMYARHSTNIDGLRRGSNSLGIRCILKLFDLASILNESSNIPNVERGSKVNPIGVKKSIKFQSSGKSSTSNCFTSNPLKYVRETFISLCPITCCNFWREPVFSNTLMAPVCLKLYNV